MTHHPAPMPVADDPDACHGHANVAVDAADRPSAEDAVAEQLRGELEGLVRIAARRPGLTLRTGQPGCNWSFAWSADLVTVDPDHLRSLAPDLCRGLALHEAAHAAVTVLHRVVAPTLLVRFHPLLNVLEDIRIEVWMRARFPGAAAWIRAYNDLFFDFATGESTPRSRQAQFLAGILGLWWHGRTPPGMLDDVHAALDECREPIAAATASQPPLDDEPAAILASQRRMWEIVRERIVPVWQRLVALDRREGIGRLADAELSRFLERSGGEMQPGRAGCPPGGSTATRSLPNTARARRRGQRPDRSAASSGEHSPAAAGSRHTDTDSDTGADTGGADRYVTAWRQVAAVADRLGDELLRVLVPRQRLRWSSGHPWGPRLDLRRAMQFEADPRQERALWRRPILPERRDPALLLLVDRSASMQGEGGRRALEGTVLLVEVCRRIGLPAAVWSFATAAREEIDWDEPLHAAARRRLGLLPDRCDGNTDLAAALAISGRRLAARRGDPKLLFVISDGEPDVHEQTLAAVGRLEADGIVTAGLGLGPGTAGLARYFGNCVTEIPPERLVDHVADLLGAAVRAHA